MLLHWYEVPFALEYLAVALLVTAVLFVAVLPAQRRSYENHIQKRRRKSEAKIRLK